MYFANAGILGALHKNPPRVKLVADIGPGEFMETFRVNTLRYVRNLSGDLHILNPSSK